ncbi:MAG: ComEC/Rec2 family competence protein [Planctomycetes bacterium]|nr:ComEC/Rec2 family competence protein [Planctomycetota bacterium]
MADPAENLPAASAPRRTYQPLVPAAAALVAGILAGEYAGGSMAAWCAAAISAAAAWGILCLRRAPDRTLLPFVLAVVAAAGAARYRSIADPPPHDVARLAEVGPRPVVLEGVIVRSPRQSSPPGDVFLPGALKGDAAGAPALRVFARSTLVVESSRVQAGGRWVPAAGQVRTVIREGLPADAAAAPDLGDRIRVRGFLLPLGGPANPGSFDAAAYLRRQGVRASLSTKHWAAVETVEPAADRLRWAVGAMRRWALARLEGLASPEGRAVAAAMLFGRRDLMDFDSGHMRGDELERAFVATGTVHFMAVSGFNVALVAAPVLMLLRLAGAGRRISAAVVSIVVLAFVLVTELEPPVLRAAILAWVVCLGWLLGRHPINLNTFAAGALLVLVMRPADLFSTSFQLTFLAVLGMMFLAGRVEGAVVGRFIWVLPYADPAVPRGGLWYRTVVQGTFLVSVAATMMTLPLVAYRFHLVGWLAPVASTVLVALVFGLTVGGMALVAVGWVAPWLGAVLAALVDGLGRTIAAVVLALAKAPGAYFHVPDFSPTWLLGAYGLMAAWVWRDRLGIPPRRLAMAALAAAAAFAWSTGHRAPENLRATFLAVGDGNTTLLELPDGRCLLYDAGSALSYARAAETATAPALWSRGITRVDAAFLSHAHFDHFKDVLPLADRFGVRQVFVPPTFMRKRLRSDDAVVEALMSRGVRVEFFGAGDRLAGTDAAEVSALWPRGPQAMGKAINDGSLVLAVEAGGRRLLLPGDLEPAGIAELLGEPPDDGVAPDLRADALLWPHHGHDPDAVGRLARASGARVLVVSAGRPLRPFERPAWLAEQGAACYHTGEAGAVTLELRPAGVRVTTFAAGQTVDIDATAPETPADRLAAEAED